MQSIRTLMEHIVDYAGLFPPAKLDMAPTVQNYATYRTGPDAWMLGRIIVPVSRLPEFESAAEALMPRVAPVAAIGTDEDDAWSISAITAAADDDALEADLAAVDAFNERHAETGVAAALIDTIELRATTPAAIERALDLIPEHIFPFFELPLATDCRGLIAAIASVGGGAKARTGGVTADAVPSIEELARFIVACTAAEVPFKATAGLHHPLRHQDPTVGCAMHGFLNVFVGACVACTHGLDASQLGAILGIESAGGIRVESESITVGSHRVTLDEIAAVRDRLAHSFGSCSFDEPLADLRSSHLLGVEGSR